MYEVYNIYNSIHCIKCIIYTIVYSIQCIKCIIQYLDTQGVAVGVYIQDTTTYIQTYNIQHIYILIVYIYTIYPTTFQQ